MIEYTSLNCKDCPAMIYKSIQRIEETEYLRLKALEGIKKDPKVILLLESTPASRFIYDPDSDYATTGLRYNLRKEFKVQSDEELFELLNKKQVWIVDTAFCPLHKLNNKVLRRKASTLCLSRHTITYLNRFKEAIIIAIFPSRCGYLKKELPGIQSRILKQFNFMDIKGLSKMV